MQTPERKAFLHHPPRAIAARLCACLLAFVLCLSAFRAHGQTSGDDSGVSAQRVEAALLYKFLFYVEWPREVMPPGAPLHIGVFNQEEVFSELAKVTAGRTFNGRAIMLRKVKNGDALSGLHMLFVGDTDRRRQEAMLRDAHRQPVLTVTETEEGLSMGSTINLRLVDDRVRFEVSLAAADRNNLKISSRMLALALQVVKGEGQ